MKKLYGVAEQWYPGCYRVKLADPKYFAQIKQIGKHQWLNEIRESETGILVGYAGIWDTVRDAVDELRKYMPVELGGQGKTMIGLRTV